MNSFRRQLLRQLGGTGIALASGAVAMPLARAQGSRAGSLALTDLGGGLGLVTGAGGNVVAHSGREGLLLVDSGAPASATSLEAFLAERFGNAGVGVLFNTHWHLDHTGGNDALVGDRSIPIIAHENTRLWMSTKFYVDWEDRHYERRAPAARPNQTFVTSDRQPLTLDFGGEEITYGHLLEAHTDGDIYVRFPQHNVVVAGGAVTAGRYPVLDFITGGWIGGMADATSKLLAMTDAQTLVVPDVGPVQRRSDLEAQVTMLTTVRERIEAIALQGRGVEDMIAERITKDFDERYGEDSAQFIANAFEGMWWSRLRGIVA
ncbi:MAG TPA: MBL fold metallo-hydrolase [Gammaproteobacteria bacterium]|nr:MBL fold metallo-hydrolase [Gammaproteobacteria bacterium]